MTAAPFKSQAILLVLKYCKRQSENVPKMIDWIVLMTLTASETVHTMFFFYFLGLGIYCGLFKNASCMMCAWMGFWSLNLKTSHFCNF